MAGMNALHPLDWLIIGTYLVGTIVLGLAFSRRASRDGESYFLAGRSLPWWVLGTSMVATTFAADTPLAVTGFVRDHGIWYNWFGWHYALAQILAVFLFSRFWRRAEVITDNQLIEMRYAGRPAASLRAFKAFYFAVLYNFIVLGWVLKGMATVAQTVLGIDPTVAVLGGAAFALAYSLMAGFWGVVVTDVVQFILAMAGAIILAVVAVGKVGGLEVLLTRLAALPQVTADTTAMIPGGGFGPESNVFKFLVFVTIMWWASHNADGGGYLIQRMSAARDERHARGATLWFVIAMNAVRYWPWILAALASLVLFPVLPDGQGSEAAYPLLMREVLGPGLLGVMLVSFFAAFMSTIDTHLNWGASYLINDVYTRFLRPAAGPRETVLVAKLCVGVMMVLAAVVAFALTSIGKAWLFVWAMGAGIGPVLILRWFWWRINAWSEIAALAASVLLAVGFEVAAAVQSGPAYVLFDTPLRVGGVALATHHKAIILVPITILVWVTVTLLTRPEPPARLAAFYRKVRPGGAWGPVAAACPDVVCDGLSRRTLLAWLAGVAMVYGILFGLGKLLLGQPAAGLVLLAVAAAATVVVVRELRR
ncbi:MAG: sodium:solute symporter family protein [Candidatus Krumholzibacteriia bacterium]